MCGYVCVQKGTPKQNVIIWVVSFFFFVFKGSVKLKSPNVQHRPYLVGPGVFVPRGELQDSYDLVDFGAHLLKDEPSVPLGLLDAGTSTALGCDKNLYSWGQSVRIKDDDGSRRSIDSTQEISNCPVKQLLVVLKKTQWQNPKRNIIRIISNSL